MPTHLGTALRALSETCVVIHGKDDYYCYVDKKTEKLGYFSKVTITKFFKAVLKILISWTSKHSPNLPSSQLIKKHKPQNNTCFKLSKLINTKLNWYKTAIYTGFSSSRKKDSYFVLLKLDIYLASN